MVSRMWQGIILVSLLTTALSTPRYPKETNEDDLVGQSTKVIATAILKDFEDNTSNLAFSPFGYSTILAILAEGSNGETEQQIHDVLKLSKQGTRNTFKKILTSLKEKYTLNVPQFQTWFYVYKNFSVEENYKKVVLDNYLTKVKNVYPHEFGEYEAHTTDDMQAEVKPVQEFTMVGLSEDEGNSPYKEKEAIEQAEKEYFMRLQETENKTLVNSHEVFPSDKLISQDDTNQVENKLVNKIQEGKTDPKGQTTKLEETQSSSTSAQHGDMKTNDSVNIKKNQKPDEVRQDVRIDFTKILPGEKHKEGKSNEDTQSLIIFNGLYFEGNWATPFENEVFIKDFQVDENNTVQIEAMKTKGLFKMGELPNLNSTALLLPYQGGRYSLLIILPSKCNGLNQLIASINATMLQDIYDTLQETEVEVELPKFAVESTTKPESAMCKIGVKSLFEKGADLTGIANETGLYAKEVVQLVTMKVSEGISSTNFMTATSVTSRGIKERFNVDHPFLFFIEDNTYKVTMVAGKFSNPIVQIL